MPMGHDTIRRLRRRANPVSAVFWLAVLVAVLGQVSAALAQPDFPSLTGRVVDVAGILRSSTERAISDQLEAHEASTTNQVVVVTVNTLQGYSIAEFGRRLGNHWGIGQVGQDNGVLLIVAPNEREVRIEVGRRLEGVLTDRVAGTIIDGEIIPFFRSGNLEGGVRAGTDAILAALGGSYEVPARSGSARHSGASFVPFLAIAVFMLVAIMFVRDMGGDGDVRSPRRRHDDDDDDWDDRHDPWHRHDDDRPRRRRSGIRWSFGGGGGSGGGFSGGGGSFGGGGASGKW